MKRSIALRCVAAAGVGVAVSTGYPIGITAAIAVPALAMLQPTRRAAYKSAFCYYAGALWPLVLAVRNFFGPSAPMIEGLAVWLVAAVLLATPWLIAWTPRRMQAFWRVPLALLATVVPPLGMMGYVSPLTAAGFFFPGTAWLGLAVFALLCSGIAASASAFRVSVATLALFALFANMNYPGAAAVPAGWEGIDTEFGAIAHGPAEPTNEYRVAQWIQERALSSAARVIVFPETVVPRWTDATDLFWQQTLASLAASGKTILVGAGLPASSNRPLNSSSALANVDFTAAVAALRSGDMEMLAHTERARSDSQRQAYQNALVIRGAQQNTFIQRVPVPLGMWRPFSTEGVPLNLFGRGTISVGNQRAAILICHEQLLTWPVLTSMLEHPTVVVDAANDYWVERTPIPRYQASAIGAWGRLFDLPTVVAVNK